MMEIIDITAVVDASVATWTGLPAPKILPFQRIADGDPVNVSNLEMNAHTGTHVDAPWHHLDDRGRIEEIGLEGFMGRAVVLDCTAADPAVDVEHLKPLDQEEPFDVLLLKTKNSTEKNVWDRFVTDYIYITPEAGEDMIRRGIKGAAIDYLSIEDYNAPPPMRTHKTMLGRIAVIEGVDLRGVEPGIYWFACLPLRLRGADGAPARAILVRDPDNAFVKAWSSSTADFSGTIAGREE